MSKKFIELPTVALRGLTVLPGRTVQFDISRIKSVRAVEVALNGDNNLFLTTQKDSEVSEPGFDDLYQIGTVVAIKQIAKLPNKVFRIMAEGKYKAHIISMTEEKRYIKSTLEEIPQERTEVDEATSKAMLEILHQQVRMFASLNPSAQQSVAVKLAATDKLEELLERIADEYLSDYASKQKYLECNNLQERFEMISVYLANQTEVMRVRLDLSQKVRDKVEQNQKEYVLREQLKVIHNELNENEEEEAEEYKKRTEELNASETVKNKLFREIKRLSSMSASSSESAVTRNYIETLLEMPWNHCTEDNNDLKNAQDILEEDHYGLEKVKERILEYLAVRSLTGMGDSPIICLVGPPGTGKTSIARSVARALNKKYVRICLGGVRDEAEIRGHRRTYVGAMPGRIVAALKEAGSANPLMLLDEIDKVGSDNYKGDTQAALLELLDSEQNRNFRDHYVELPVDLSQVLFIATANDLSTVSAPLRDRMEIIEVGSYTANEKFHIAKKYLVTKQISKNGLKKKQLRFTDGVLHKIIEGYTREAGVRGLERQIGTVCRKAAKEILTGETRSIAVNERNLEKYLGKIKYEKETAFDKPQVGIVRGLAWTSVGGDTLSIEVNTMPGKGKLKLTGQLGDVMKESAEAALSYVRSVAKSYGVPAKYFEEHDIHVHIPEGATPKDGPSAGITLASALLSAVSGKKARADVAMTGEITLRGRVLPIGGLKEKLLAAKNAGMKIVLVPKQNQKDVLELSEEITGGMEIMFVEKMDTVLKTVLI